LLLTGCATSSYRVLFQDDSAAELDVTPDRILLECEDLHDADIKGMYGFMVHVLDGQNKVITIAQSNTLDKKSCNDRLKGIGRILKEGKDIYIAGRGDLGKTRENIRGEYAFPGKGTFQSGGRVLSFVAIANERGLCYAAFGGFGERPCPPEPFPLRDARREP
jgi:hypothetical protein